MEVSMYWRQIARIQ